MFLLALALSLPKGSLALAKAKFKLLHFLIFF